MKKHKTRTKKQAEAFTKFFVLGRLYGMRTTIIQIKPYYGDLGLNQTFIALEEAIEAIRDGKSIIKTAIPYRNDSNAKS